MKDELGNRMKDFYEDRAKAFLPRRTYTVIRVDGKAFHTYTRGLKKPFDDGLIDDMDATACYLCKNIQGAKLGFVQSDEISIVTTDFDKIDTDAWFDGNVQKIVSITASMAAAMFNHLRMKRIIEGSQSVGEDGIISIRPYGNDLINMKLAEFDARAFTIPTKTEVMNYLIWRQNDTVRNSIASVAQNLYSPKELNGKSCNEQQELIFKNGINWNDYAAKYKRGRIILKKQVELENSMLDSWGIRNNYIRNVWTSMECPIFTQDTEYLLDKIPNNL